MLASHLKGPGTTPCVISVDEGELVYAFFNFFLPVLIPQTAPVKCEVDGSYQTLGLQGFTSDPVFDRTL